MTINRRWLQLSTIKKTSLLKEIIAILGFVLESAFCDPGDKLHNTNWSFSEISTTMASMAFPVPEIKTLHELSWTTLGNLETSLYLISFVILHWDRQ